MAEELVLSRRGLLKGAAVVGATLGLAARQFLPVDLGTVVAEARPRKKKLRAYRLTTTHPCHQHHGEGTEGSLKRRACEGCKACQGLADNTFFVNRGVAQRPGNRAHKHCQCVVYSQLIPEASHYAAFGYPGCGRKRKVFDQRRDAPFTPCR